MYAGRANKIGWPFIICGVHDRKRQQNADNDQNGFHVSPSGRPSWRPLSFLALRYRQISPAAQADVDGSSD